VFTWDTFGFGLEVADLSFCKCGIRLDENHQQTGQIQVTMYATETMIHLGCDGYTILRWSVDRFRWSWLLRHVDWVNRTFIFSVKQSQKVRSSQNSLLGLSYCNTTPRRNVRNFIGRHSLISRNTVRPEPNNLWRRHHYDQFDHSKRGHCAVTGVCRVQTTVISA